MASAWSQQALSISFILIEGIYSWATESEHAHYSSRICLDCCWREKVTRWSWRLQHPGVVAEVSGLSVSLCSQEKQKDLLGVCCPACECCVLLERERLIKPFTLCVIHLGITQFCITSKNPLYWISCHPEKWCYVAGNDCAGQVHR